MSQMIEKSIRTPRGKVYYWTNDLKSDFGLVFCHGLTADHHLFDKQVEGFKDYKLLVWDWPLHGKSKDYKGFSYDNVSDDLKEILMAEGLESILLIGQSAGGYIGQAFIKKYPELVKGFIGIGTTPFGQDNYKKSEMFWIKHFSAIAGLYPYEYYCKLSAKAVTNSPQARESMYKTLKSMSKKEILHAAKSVYDAFLDEKDQLVIECPVLLTYGQDDKTGYVKRYNKEWAERDGYKLLVIDDASHNANYDNYRIFNQIIIDFIDKEIVF